jgi:hypothetical protein
VYRPRAARPIKGVGGGGQLAPDEHTWGRKQIHQFGCALIFQNNMWRRLAARRMNKQAAVLGEAAGKG